MFLRRRRRFQPGLQVDFKKKRRRIACRGLASTLALLFTPVNSERAGAEHVGVAAASRSTPSSVLASAPGRLRPEAAAVQSERPHAAFQRQLLVVCALRQQRSSQSDSPRCLPEPRHSARVSQSQASQSPHQRASATRAVVPSFLSVLLSFSLHPDQRHHGSGQDGEHGLRRPAVTRLAIDLGLLPLAV